MDHLISLIAILGYFGYALLFLVIFLESLPPTFFFPGDSLLFTAGFLASQGHFNIVLLSIIFFSASILGYIVSYFIGQKIRHIILEKRKFLWVKPVHIEKTHRFFERYGAKTIVIGRFVPIVRSFAPALAGAADMKYSKFIRFAILGAVLWAVGLTLGGYYLGRLFPNAHVYLTPIIAIIILVSSIPIFIEYISEHKRRKKERLN